MLSHIAVCYTVIILLQYFGPCVVIAYTKRRFKLIVISGLINVSAHDIGGHSQPCCQMPPLYHSHPLGIRRCCDVESTSMTLIQCRNNIVCPLGTESRKWSLKDICEYTLMWSGDTALSGISLAEITIKILDWTKLLDSSFTIAVLCNV